MACCILIALAFALPFMVLRQVSGWFGGSAQCSMAWQPAGLAHRPPTEMTQSPKNAVSTGFATGTGFSIANRAKSFLHAGRGMYLLLRYEHSAWIQLSFMLVVIALSLELDISGSDWRWMMLLIGMVLCAEGLNTAIEYACNAVSVEYCEHIKTAKDVAAGAVLLISLTAAAIGVQTLLPYVKQSIWPIADPLPLIDDTQTFNSSFGSSLSEVGV